MRRVFITLLFLSLALLGCNEGLEGIDTLSSIETEKAGDEDITPAPITENFELSICSELNFAGVTWSSELRKIDRNAFALALSITGSFEGHAGWSNLSNNFDGQGFSMGLLNQNLGQGSLQPLLIIMFTEHLSVMQSLFSTAQLNAMVQMLLNWQPGAIPSPLLLGKLAANTAVETFNGATLKSVAQRSPANEVKDQTQGVSQKSLAKAKTQPAPTTVYKQPYYKSSLGEADIDKYYFLENSSEDLELIRKPENQGARRKLYKSYRDDEATPSFRFSDRFLIFSNVSSGNQGSVNWAVNTVYVSGSDRTFKSEWRTALKALASHPVYVSLQIAAAERLHRRALGYVERADFSTLNAYLFMFDIVVQNGSLRNSHFNDFFAWEANNPNATDTERMLALLEIRVLSSRPQFRDDVRSRKRAVILGSGVVHGSQRELQTEYCYDQNVVYP